MKQYQLHRDISTQLCKRVYWGFKNKMNIEFRMKLFGKLYNNFLTNFNEAIMRGLKK